MKSDPSTKILTEALLDIPIVVEIDGRSVTLYPPSLGITLMVDRILHSMSINRGLMVVYPQIEMLAMTEKYADEMTMIVALHTFKHRKDASDMDALSVRMEELTMSQEDLAVAYMRAMSMPTAAYYSAELGIDSEIERRHNIMGCKKPSTNMPTGGVTLYGGLIDVACERYKWTLDYVLWDISLHNLKLLLSDVSSDVFLTDEEYKRARRYRKSDKSRRGTIKADDPKNIAKVAEFFKDMD